MDHALQILVLALANVPTMITVLIGILINNSRISDLNSRNEFVWQCAHELV